MAEHFTQWVWAGYAAKQAPVAVTAEIRAHLAAGCASCGEENRFWQSLASTMQFEQLLQREPLPTVARERVLAMAQMPPAQKRASWTGARLSFDSFTTPMPATVRGMAARRLCVYELDGEPGARVDVMVERVGRHDGWSVVGQVLNAKGEGWRDCAVDLTEAELESVATPSGRTNAFGEFSFVRANGNPWRLDLQVGQKRFGIAPLLMP